MFALLGVFLMTSGIFVLISYIPPSASGNNGNGGTAIPALSNVGETAGTSISVNYWTQSSVANSGTTTVTLPVNSNSSVTDISFSTPTGGWTISSGTVTGSFTSQNYYDYGTAYITMGLILPLTGYSQDNSEGVLTNYYSVGTVTIGITIDGTEATGSYAFNTAGEIANNANAGYIEMAFTVYTPNVFGNYPTTFSVQITSDSGNTISQLFEATTSSSSPSNFYTYSGTSNSIIQDDSSQPSQAPQPLTYGFHFGSTSTSFTIPQYESSFGISWTSSSSANPQYNSEPIWHIWNIDRSTDL